MYFYPDINDKNINILIKILEPYKGYWEKSEYKVLCLAERIFKYNKYKRMLDLGAGIGRLTIKFSKYFNDITIIEPDKERLQKAKESIKRKNIKFIKNSFLNSKLPKEYFDVIICSHVIQHIKTKDIIPTINKIYNILKKNGILVLLTCYSRKNYDFFTKLFIERNNVKELNISESEFNNLIINKKMILPIHFFSIKTIKKILSKFSIITFKIFHLKRDIFIIARKNN
ncbi:MAG: class I SAM-dependent methyltransferase [Candidatus Aenigmatarchaeota archaeon]